MNSIVITQQLYKFQQIRNWSQDRCRKRRMDIYTQLGYNNQLQQMHEVQSGQLVKVQPQNVIVFYRNEFQSASTIKITKNHELKQSIKFYLKTTNKRAYLVSQSSGELSALQLNRYINILINQNYPLQQCLHDRFKLLIVIPNKPPIEKKFKVIIDYKKEVTKANTKDLQRLQVGSKASGNVTSNPSILGQPITNVKKSMLKRSQIVNYMGTTTDTERLNVKEELDETVKKVQDRRSRLGYLNKQIQKNKSRRRLIVYIAIITIIVSFLLGIAVKQSLKAGLNYMNTLDY